MFSRVVFCSHHSVELGLVFLCPPDWQCRVCDRRERHQSPIRSTALINLFKQTGSRSQKKSFQSSSKKKAIKMDQGDKLSDTRVVGCTFIDGLEPESFVYTCMHVNVARREDYGSLCLWCRSAWNEELTEESQTQAT